MRRALFDINVILDVLLDRKPFAGDSSAAWATVENGEVEGFLSAHSITTLHYRNAKAVGVKLATETTEALLSVFEIAPVNEAVLQSAIALEFDDYENAVAAVAARRAKCDVVITRDPRDFKDAPIKVLTPAEAVAWIETSK